MSDSHLEFQDLHRSFGYLKVLSGISGRVDCGESLLITGSNGSGKSTLLRCLAGLLAHHRGKITYREAGDDLDARTRRRRLGFLSPDLSFYEELTTLENLLFFARLRGVPAERCSQWLEKVRLPEDRLAGALSSGMRQRLRWAWALLHEPTLLLLDEPLQNLDPPSRELARNLLAEHLRHGLAVIANPASIDVGHVERHLDLDG